MWDLKIKRKRIKITQHWIPKMLIKGNFFVCKLKKHQKIMYAIFTSYSVISYSNL